MKLRANIINIKSTKKGTYPGDKSGESIIITQEGSAEKGETSQQYGQAGFISNPAKNVKGIRLRIGSIDICIGAFNYGVVFPEKPGESKIYSTDAEGVEKSAINLKDDGTIEINGNADNAVSFQDLKTALDNFKTSLDTSIAGSITGHTHVITTAPGTSAPGVGSAPSTTIDITASKVDGVKLP